MGLSINTNIASMTTAANLSNTESSLSKSLERLSSGLRINSSSDDAAGLAIATNIGTQVSGLTVASQNIKDGTAIANTTDGALSTVQSILARVRDLTVQAANGTNDASSMSDITTEITQLGQELSRMAASVNYNGTALLTGKATVTLQVGANTGPQDQVSLDLTQVKIGDGTGVETASATGTIAAQVLQIAADLTPATQDSAGALAAQAKANADLAKIDTAVNTVSTQRAVIGAVENRLTDAASTITSQITNLSAAKSNILDVDMASEMANYTKQQVLAQAGTAMLSQANSMPQLALKLLQS